MNRSNIGNVVTNGMQILSVGATTGARTLGRADKVLNNLSPDEQKSYFEMKANKIRDDINSYNNKSESALQHLSEEEKITYREKQANDIREYIGKDNDNDIDSLMSDIVTRGEQSQEINTRTRADINWLNDWFNKNLSHKNIITISAKQELLNQIKGDE